MRAGPAGDPDHAARRDAALIVAVECAAATSTCFCTSMASGPEVDGGADLMLSELDDGFVVRVGSEAGAGVVGPLGLRAASARCCRSGRYPGCRGARRDRGPGAGRRPAGAAASRARSSPLGAGRRALPGLRQLHARLPDLLLHERWRRFGPGRPRRNDPTKLGQLLQPWLRAGRRRCELPAEGPRPLPPVADPQVLDLVGPVRLEWLRRLRPVHRLVPGRHRRPRRARGDRATDGASRADPVAAFAGRRTCAGGPGDRRPRAPCHRHRPLGDA